MTPTAVDAAFFDIDGTLFPAPSMERRFIRWLWHRRVIGLSHLRRSVSSILTTRPWSVASFKANKAYLRGLEVEQMRSLGEEFVSNHLIVALRRAACNAIAPYQEQHTRVVLLTGSLDLLVAPLAHHLGIEGFIAGRVESEDRRLTGRIIPPHPYGNQKSRALGQYAERHGIDLQNSILYSDNLSDVPSFRLVGEAVVINPRPALARMAARRGWMVQRWDDLI